MTGGPRVAVVYNEPVLAADHPDYASEADVVAVADAVAGALRGAGFEAETLPLALPIEASLKRLLDRAPDLVFNLVEGFAGRSPGATYFPALLELAGLPYTGSPVEALAACQSKGKTKALLRGFGLPTADFALVRPGEPVPELPFPLIVKPDEEDGSLGIDQGSVVSDRDGLTARVEHLRRTHGGSVLVESYLPGLEFNVGVLALPEAVALPVGQIAYHPRAEGWPILTYESKWDGASAEAHASVSLYPAPIAAGLAARLSELAVSACAATGCRDCTRVDFRLDAGGAPCVLEVNPNPDIGPTAGLARAALVAGWGYERLIAGVAGEALRRAGRGMRFA